MKKRKFFFLIPVLILLLLPLVVMMLWNYIVSDIFPIKHISYVQALGLLVLCRILFGSFRFGNRAGSPPFFKRKAREKWLNMTDEEKQQFRDEWKKRKRNC